MDEQNADLNQPSGIFGEEKKGFFDFLVRFQKYLSRKLLKRTRILWGRWTAIFLLTKKKHQIW